MADVQPENGTTQNELIGDGYIILARRVFNNDHWVWQLPPNHFKFLIGIIFAARWGKNPADFTAPDGTVLKIKRGQYACAERRLAEKFKLSRQVIRTCLKKLSSYGFLTHEVTHGITVITVLNYDTYQNPALYYNPENNPSLTQGQPKPNPLKNKENKDKQDNNIYSRLREKWNEQKSLMQCRSISDKTQGNINARLNDYTEDELLRAVESYGTVMDWSKKGVTWWTHSYPFADFWETKNELERWLSDINNFKREKGNRRPQAVDGNVEW